MNPSSMISTTKSFSLIKSTTPCIVSLSPEILASMKIFSCLGSLGLTAVQGTSIGVGSISAKGTSTTYSTVTSSITGGFSAWYILSACLLTSAKMSVVEEPKSINL